MKSFQVSMKKSIAICFVLCMHIFHLFYYTALADQNEIRRSIVRIYASVEPDLMKLNQEGLVLLMENGLSIEGQAWTGSAFAIGTDANEVQYFVTNKHCVSAEGWLSDFNLYYRDGSKYIVDGEEVTIPLPVKNVEMFIIYDDDGGALPVELACSSDDYDIAVLKLQSSMSIREPAVLHPFEGLIYADVWACGFPGVADIFTDGKLRGGTESATITKGIISRVISADISKGSGELLQIDADVNHGNSGGALVNENGEVLGIPTRISNASGFNVAISVNEVVKLLDQYKME